MNPYSGHTTFMAGATGFLGHFVLRDLLRHGWRVAAMVRPPLSATRDRLARLMAEIHTDIHPYEADGRLILVPGLLPHDLPEPTWGRTDLVLNCAASLQLACDDSGEPDRTNVQGTAALLDWADRHGVSRFHAVSTAYTCGWNAGRIMERLHHPRPQFQTDYERTKWQAELLAAEWGRTPGRSVTILRPSFLIGEWATGYSSQFSGFYVFARLIHLLREQFRDPNNGVLTHVPLRIPLPPDGRHNIVPVDFVAGAIAAAVAHDSLHGRIYHLTNPLPPTNEDVRRWFEDFFHLDGGVWVNPGDLNGDATQAEALVWKQIGLVLPRATHCPQFDQSNTSELMSRAGLRFPTVDRDCIFRTLDVAVSRGWGRHGANGSPARTARSNGRSHA